MRHLTFTAWLHLAVGICTAFEADDSSVTLYHTRNGDRNSDKLVVKNQVAYVGGTNYFLEVNLNKLSPENIKRVNFTATEKYRNTCKQFTPGAHCENTVRILEFVSHESILICGTNAKAAKCYLYRKENSSFEEKNLDQRSWISESPSTRTISLLTGHSELYVASTPSAATGGVFVRTMSTTKPDLKTTKDWLDDPEFMGVYDVPEKDYVYIFFNEKSTYFVGNEFDSGNGKKDYYSMVARVCKNDQGGSWMSQTWMTFSKARLICPWLGSNENSGENLYYNELVSSFQTNDSIFGLFTTSRNWNLATYALAEYDTDVIDDVIGGISFADNKTKYFHPSKTNREVVFEPSAEEPPFYPGQCPVTRTYTLKSELEQFLLKNTLVKMNIFPKGRKPFFVGDSEAKFRFIFVQTLSWCKLIFLLTGSGYLKKIMLLPDGTTTELFEHQMSSAGDEILAAKLVEEKRFILATTATKVLAISLQLCSSNTDCVSCSADPHCEWRADLTGFDFVCEVAGAPRQRTCSSRPHTPKNLSVQVGEDSAVISWTQDGVPAQISNIITVEVNKTKEIIHRNKTTDKALLVKRSILQDGCVYEVAATAVNHTMPSEESRTTFYTGLRKPELLSHGARVVEWKAVPGAEKYFVVLADGYGGVMQEIFILAAPDNHKFYLPYLNDDKPYTVTVRAVSADNVESTAYINIAPITTSAVSMPPTKDCLGVTFALAAFAALFVCSLVVIIHNIWTIKPKVNELKSDVDGCSYKRQYLLIWSKKNEQTHLNCDDAVMSSTSA